MFGTYYLPKGEWPEDKGLLEVSFPKDDVRQANYPFAESPFEKDLVMEEYSKR